MSAAPDGLDEARRLLEAAERVVVVTGAGMSAESGVPTFRGEEGLWRSHRPEELATPGAFRRDPELVWAWYRWRRARVASCAPNAGHLALAAFAARRPETRIVTQNVDGLHDEAARRVEGGGAAAPVLELHGALFGDRCSGCGRRSSARDDRSGEPPGQAPDDAPDAAAPLPRCDACGALLRPDVVWFGEGLDGAVLDEAFQAAGAADLCLVVGTSALVQPAASVPLATLRDGGDLVEVNPEPTPLSGRCRVTLRAGAAVALPALLDGVAGAGTGGAP